MEPGCEEHPEKEKAEQGTKVMREQNKLQRRKIHQGNREKQKSKSGTIKRGRLEQESLKQLRKLRYLMQEKAPDHK